MIDVIIPTIPGREESLERLLASIHDHTDITWKATIVPNSETCGWGWMKGLEDAHGDYVLLACDDQQFVHGDWAGVCIETVNQGFLPCPRVWMPDGRMESNGGDMNAYAHITARPQKDRTPVDYTTVPFLSREQIDKIGMLPVHYASDVWVSYRGRQLGYETILRHGYEVVHYQEVVGRGAGMPQSERDAMDCEVVFQELEKAPSQEPSRSVVGAVSRRRRA